MQLKKQMFENQMPFTEQGFALNTNTTKHLLSAYYVLGTGAEPFMHYCT